MRKPSTLVFLTAMGLTAAAQAAVINPSLNSGLCLDVAGGSSANGTKIQIANCYSNDAAQNFSIVGNTIRVLGKCLDVKGGSTANFTQLQLYDCGAGDNVNQQFVLQNGTIKWKNHSNCLDIPNARANDGQPIQMYSCSTSDKAQQWTTSLSTGSTTSTTTPTATSPSGPTSAPSGGRLMNFVNKCSQTVWVALQNNGGKPIPSPSGFTLTSGKSQNVALPYQWGGRMWGRSGCNVSGNSATCASGDCGGLLACNGIGGQPASLVEFLFDGWAGTNATQDYYDISLVDAFNLPVAIKPNGGSGVCHAPSCSANILASCPADLQVKDSSGKVVTCLSSCTKYQTDDTCCRGAHDTSATCPAPEGAKVFKSACPDAYSYAYDDGTSTWNCTNPSGYTITFCP